MRAILIFLVVFLVIFFISNTIGFDGVVSISSNFNDGRVLGISEFVDNEPAGPSDELSEDLLASYKKFSDGLKTDQDFFKETSYPVDITIEAKSGVVFDSQKGTVLFDKNSKEELPIASITKLATALVFLDYNPGWENFYEIQPNNIRVGGKIYLSAGEKVRIRDLFYLSLVGSANTATIALVYSTGMSEEEFIEAMNKKMMALGLTHTRFRDPVGLSSLNVSTALEVAQLGQVALANEDIRQATLTRRYEFTTQAGKKKIVENTDVLLDIFPQNGIILSGGKTGYNKAAGYCFVGKFKDDRGREVVSVILGDSGKFSRFSQTKDLIEWVFSYEWQ